MSGPDTNDPESWITYRRLVVGTLEDLENRTRQMETDLLTIKIKAGLMGALAGLIPSGIMLALAIWEWLKH